MKLLTALQLTWRALVTKDEQAQFALAEKLCAFLYPTYKFSEFGRIFLNDHEFLRYYERFEGTRNYHSLDRKFTLSQLLKLTKTISGDTAECGAYQGASSYLICEQNGGLGKTHHIFDSFAGLSQPTAMDGAYWQPGSLSSGEEVIRENLKAFPFVQYYKGWIPERFPEAAPFSFSFLHIDVDLYQPTWDSLCFFYERMTPGGIILCDDYGFSTCPGAYQAMSTFFADKAEAIIHLPTGQAFIIKE
ncbi:MAG: TylF/MycF/NovP-related O-methyltransferase [Caldilineaceae bacterium]